MRQSYNSSGFETQAEKIENLLRSRYGHWIPAYELADVALQYCARINAIRKKLRAAGDTEEIENQTKRVNGQVHGSYRIRTKDTEPARETRQERAERFERQFGSRPSSHPWKTAFSEKRLADPGCFELTPPEPRVR